MNLFTELETAGFDWHHHFNSTIDLIDTASGPQSDVGDRNTGASRGTSRDNWYGTANYEEAENLALEGWRDAPDLEGKRDQILGSPIGTSDAAELIVQHSVAGAFVDVGRFVEGHPECMMEFAEHPSPKAYRIAVSLTGGCREEPEMFQWRGAVALALTDQLSRAGANVELCGIAYQRHKGHCHLTSVVLKRASEITDKDALAFWLSHPSALRRVLFGFWESLPPKLRRKAGYCSVSGYGSAIQPDRVPGFDLVVSGTPQNQSEASTLFNRYHAELTEDAAA